MTILADQTTAYEPTPADWLDYEMWLDQLDREWWAEQNQDAHATEPTPLEDLEPPSLEVLEPPSLEDDRDESTEVRMGLNPKADRAVVLMALSERRERRGTINRRYRRTHHGLFSGPLSERDARSRLDWHARQHASRRRWWIARQQAMIGGAR